MADYRKLKRRTRTGFSLTYIDQFVDELLTKDRVCATSLWKLPTRPQLEDLELLEERVSPLGAEIDEIDADEELPNGGAEREGSLRSGDENAEDGNQRDADMEDGERESDD